MFCFYYKNRTGSEITTRLSSAAILGDEIGNGIKKKKTLEHRGSTCAERWRSGGPFRRRRCLTRRQLAGHSFSRRRAVRCVATYIITRSRFLPTVLPPPSAGRYYHARPVSVRAFLFLSFVRFCPLSYAA